jgi:hypothetical protein
LLAHDSNAMKRPSPDTSGAKLQQFARAPDVLTSTCLVVPGRRLWTKTSHQFVSGPGTRFEALETNATTPPRFEIASSSLRPLLWSPEELTLTRLVSPLRRPWTKTSFKPLSSASAPVELSARYSL